MDTRDTAERLNSRKITIGGSKNSVNGSTKYIFQDRAEESSPAPTYLKSSYIGLTSLESLKDKPKK